MDPALAAELESLGNHIRFFKNGVDQGVAYRQIPGGTLIQHSRERMYRRYMISISMTAVKYRLRPTA
eukprot:45028-Eustigmatos_ZCMA.PRE.1